jgi:hypothetical protein
MWRRSLICSPDAWWAGYERLQFSRFQRAESYAERPRYGSGSCLRGQKIGDTMRKSADTMAERGSQTVSKTADAMDEVAGQPSASDAA